MISINSRVLINDGYARWVICNDSDDDYDGKDNGGDDFVAVDGDDDDDDGGNDDHDDFCDSDEDSNDRTWIVNS